MKHGLWLVVAWMLVGAQACDVEPATEVDASQVCAPMTSICSGDDLLVCSYSGDAYTFVRTCPDGCRDRACVGGDEPDVSTPEPDTAGADTTAAARGCVGCPCDFGEACDAGLVCFAGYCLPPGCQVDADCGAGRRCYLGGCVPALCGNHQLDDGEECDDGNNKNGDGCNVNCADEPLAPLAGGEPVGFQTGSAGMPVAFAACSDEAGTGPFAPGPSLPVRVCAFSYLDAQGQGLSAAQVAAELERAGQYYAAAGTAVVLTPLHVDVRPGGPDQTDPDSDGEIQAVLSTLRQVADASYAGQCQAVVGFVHSIRSGASSYGGMATWPSEGLHSAIVTASNAEYVPGETTAHELGHVFGLFHTHETATADDDGCSDTGADAGCFGQVPPSCSLTCPDGSVPPAANVMSYYFCDTPGASSFSACQARRARCFVSKMWPAAACPLPLLSSPAEAASFPVGASIAFSWSNGDPGVDHRVVVRQGGANGPVAWSKVAGTLGTTKAPAGTFAEGSYTWTVEYPGSCCAGGTCAAVARTFTVASVACAGASTQACGWCGVQSRACQPDGTWGAWGECGGQGECGAGTLSTCPGGSQVTCTDDCAWPACPACTPSCAGRCPGADDGCGGTCSGNGCSGCCDGTACVGGHEIEACGSGGGACLACVPSADCLGGACTGCGHDAGEPAACADNDSPGCAQVLASLTTQADQWLSMSQPAAPSPAGDVDHFRVDLTDTAFFAVLDPTVQVTAAGAALTVCAWWKNADGAEVTLTSCDGGTLDVHAADGSEWAGAPGCCQGVAGLGTGAELTLSPSATATGSLLIAVQASGPASCGRYSFRFRL